MGNNKLFVSTESGGINEVEIIPKHTAQLSFRHFNTLNGLNSDITQGLTIQGQTLWITGSNQVLTLDIRHLKTASYGTNFWGEALRFSDARPLKLADGRWLLGLLDGAMTVSNRQFARKSYVPPIYLTSISIKNQPNNYHVNQLRTLVLNPNERSLTVNFKAIDYTPNANIRYATRLDKDKAWLFWITYMPLRFSTCSPAPTVCTSNRPTHTANGRAMSVCSPSLLSPVSQRRCGFNS